MTERFALVSGSAILALLAANAQAAATSDSPRKIYDRDVTCAAGAVAAFKRTGYADPDAKVKSIKLSSLTIKDAHDSGAKIGLNQQQVGHDIEAQTDSVMARLNASDQSKVKQEVAELRTLLIDCALVHRLEAR